MKASVIYHSYSGITRGVAEKVHEAVGGDITEVKPANPYSKISAYTLGCMRARKGDCDEIVPQKIDVSDASVIVIGTPVWAFRATPAINAAVKALSGCEGKPAVIFATCGGSEGDTIPVLKKALEEKGVKVEGEFVFDKNGVLDPKKIESLSDAVLKAGST